MDQTTLKIAASGLIHDIGKLTDKELLGVEDGYIEAHAGLYLPYFNGRYSHHHAVYTAAFIEQMKDALPPQFNSPAWGEGDAFINLAAGHHKPETPMQWVVAVADRVSSGWDRDVFEKGPGSYVPWKDYKKTRLLPMFEQLSLERTDKYDRSEGFEWCYPLKPISPGSIFPVLRAESLATTPEAAQEEYAALFGRFSNNLRNLKNRDTDISLWLEHFDSLLMIYTSAVPSARAGDVVPDVSLYDHSRMTSALASALYLYHRDSDTLTVQEVKDYDQKKFLIVSGDFQGIQKYIFSRFGDSTRYRSKMLRGRSFAVSLMAELAADLICREIGLPSISTILNAAGKFMILAPNTEKTSSALIAATLRLNNWLFDSAYGETAINISTVKAACTDFVSGKFTGLWEHVNRAMAEKKFESLDLERHGGVVKGYLDHFLNDSGHPLCPLCGKRPSVRGAGGSAYVPEVPSACAHCRDHIFLGTNLVKRDRLCVLDASARRFGREEMLFEPLFGRYQVFFPGQDLLGKLDEFASSGELIRYWNVSLDPEMILKSDSAVKFINGYVPKYSPEDNRDERLLHGRKGDAKKLELIEQIKEGDPKTLNHLALMALNPSKDGEGFKAVAALGVLKADVDHLGLLMSCGLKNERFTVSRLATQSRQLNYFFTLYLPHLLRRDERFKDVYTVFAGGDDLFLIGPWNRLVDLSALLRKSFARYVCGNPGITFSAGISFHKPQTPIDTMAGETEEALEQSKEEGRDRLTVFSETVEWKNVETLLSIRNTLKAWLDRGWVSDVLFYRFNEFIRMAAREQQVVKNNEVSIDDMACTKWRALLVYTTERNVAKNIKGDDRRALVTEVTATLVKWLEGYEGKLRIPLWDVAYNRRNA